MLRFSHLFCFHYIKYYTWKCVIFIDIFCCLKNMFLCRNIKNIKGGTLGGAFWLLQKTENSLCAVSIDIGRYGAVIVLHFTKLG